VTLAQILVAACEMEFILLLVVRGDESWRCKILKQVSIKVFSHLSACINLCKKLCIPFPSSFISDIILKNASKLLRFNQRS